MQAYQPLSTARRIVQIILALALLLVSCASASAEGRIALETDSAMNVPYHTSIDARTRLYGDDTYTNPPSEPVVTQDFAQVEERMVIDVRIPQELPEGYSVERCEYTMFLHDKYPDHVRFGFGREDTQEKTIYGFAQFIGSRSSVTLTTPEEPETVSLGPVDALVMESKENNAFYLMWLDENILYQLTCPDMSFQEAVGIAASMY